MSATSIPPSSVLLRPKSITYTKRTDANFDTNRNTDIDIRLGLSFLGDEHLRTPWQLVHAVGNLARKVTLLGLVENTSLGASGFLPNGDSYRQYQKIL
jgi:hypothetical protein